MTDSCQRALTDSKSASHGPVTLGAYVWSVVPPHPRRGQGRPLAGLARVALALGLGWLCIMVTCASGPLGGPPTVTAAQATKVDAGKGAIAQPGPGAAPAPFGSPALPRLALAVLATLALLLLAGVVTGRVTATEPPVPARRWRVADPPRRGPPVLLAH